jgi:hypothetical protein
MAPEIAADAPVVWRLRGGANQFKSSVFGLWLVPAVILAYKFGTFPAPSVFGSQSPLRFISILQVDSCFRGLGR